MAKKLNKVLALTAFVSAAVVGGIALFKKLKKSETDYDDDTFDFDEFDDECEDPDGASQKEDGEREYVSIPREGEAQSEVKVDVKIESKLPEEETEVKEETGGTKKEAVTEKETVAKKADAKKDTDVKEESKEAEAKKEDKDSKKKS